MGGLAFGIIGKIDEIGEMYIQIETLLNKELNYYLRLQNGNKATNQYIVSNEINQ